MQALILAGGEGTRLRPLTSTIAKPVVPLVEKPFISYMLEWLRGHGVDEVILACGFMADSVREVLGDGSQFGLALRYTEEPHPLGTGGALKFAERLLDEQFFMLNGDVLTDLDLTEQRRQHEATSARATLALIEVEDPAAYGLVRCDPDQSVIEFVEKPGSEEDSDASLINAGAYILERDVLGAMAKSGTNISIERDVFPALVGHGLFGYRARGYWLDIGTPARYLQGTFDILEGNVRTAVGRRLADASLILVRDAEIEGGVVPPAIVGRGSRVAADAIVGGRAVLGEGVIVENGARVESSVLLDGAKIGARTTVSGSILGPNVEIGEDCHIGGVVLGERVTIGADNVLAAGARIFPGVQLPAGAVRF